SGRYRFLASELRNDRAGSPARGPRRGSEGTHVGSSELGLVGRVVVITLCAVGTASPGRAQQAPGPSSELQADSLSPAQQEQRAREVERWIRDYRKWQEWRHQALKHGAIPSKDRKPQPQPPTWLVDECRTTTFATGTLTSQACDLLVG